MLQVKFENLGPIKEGTIHMNKLTVLCGENHTGKTYASYTMYGFLKELGNYHRKYSVVENVESLGESGQIDFDLDKVFSQFLGWINKLCESFSDNLYKVFSSKMEVFINTKISAKIVNWDRFRDEIFRLNRSHSISSQYYNSNVTMSKMTNTMVASLSYSIGKNEGKVAIYSYIDFLIDQFLFGMYKSDVFLLPAERSGLNLFYKELNATRNEFVHDLGVELLNKSDNGLEMRLRKNISPYPIPISDYLTFLNRFDWYRGEESTFKDIAEEIQRTILKGNYEIQDQQILYKNEGGQTFHLHISSSTVKSLFGLVFYLTYMAQPGQTLIIDEPELNLHPDNQRKLAKILAKIANRGIWVILSTHSDYIVKEFNNLIMLSKTTKKREELMQKYDYDESQLLKPDDVSAYLFIDDRITPMEIDPNEGIIAETFDQVINRHNEATDEIYYAIQEEE